MLKFLLKFLILLTLIFALIKYAHLDQLKFAITNSSPQWIILATFTLLLSQFIELLRLSHNLMNYLKSFKLITKILFLRIFTSTFFPVSLGGDLVIVYYLKKASYGWAECIASLTIMKLCGFAFLGSITIFYIFKNLNQIFFLNYLSLNNASFTKLTEFTVLVLLCFIIFYFLSKKFKFLDQFKKLIYSSIAILKKMSFQHIIIQFILASGYQSCRGLGYLFLVLAFNNHIEFIQILVVLFVATFVAIFQINFMSLGLQEGAIIFLLTYFGVSLQAAILISVIARVVDLLPAIVGCFFITAPFKSLNTFRKQIS